MKIKEKIIEIKRKREYKENMNIRKIIRNWKINREINKLLNKDYKEIVYLQSNTTQDLTDIDYFDYYDLIYIKTLKRFFPIPLIKEKNREKIKDLAWTEKIKLLSRNWYEKFKYFSEEYTDILLNSEEYYPDFEIIMLKEEDLYNIN